MRYRTIIVAAAVAVALAACAAGQDPAIQETSPPTTPPETTTSTPSPTPDGTVEPEAGSTERIEVTVSGGQADGPGTVPLTVGTEVELVVTSDVADHVHVHGYDLFQDVAAGETVTMTFMADIPGVFEVELEDSGTHLLELEVSG